MAAKGAGGRLYVIFRLEDQDSSGRQRFAIHECYFSSTVIEALHKRCGAMIGTSYSFQGAQALVGGKGVCVASWSRPDVWAAVLKILLQFGRVTDPDAHAYLHGLGPRLH